MHVFKNMNSDALFNGAWTVGTHLLINEISPNEYAVRVKLDTTQELVMCRDKRNTLFLSKKSTSLA